MKSSIRYSLPVAHPHSDAATPPPQVFIIRSVTTLDFCAVRTNCNMYELAAPVAIWRALTPRTDAGRLALKKALLTDANQINWDRLQV